MILQPLAQVGSSGNYGKATRLTVLEPKEMLNALRETMLTLKSVSFVVPIILIGLAAVPSVKADPLFFSNVVALQNGGATRVDLFSNPGITLLGPQISFLVDITGTLPPGGTDTLSITYNQAGSPPITLMVHDRYPCSQFPRHRSDYNRGYSRKFT